MYNVGKKYYMLIYLHYAYILVDKGEERGREEGLKLSDKSFRAFLNLKPEFTTIFRIAFIF